MSKSSSKKLSALILSLFLCLFFAVHAKAYNNGYYIKSYDVDIVVNEDNTFDVTEKLTVHFDDDAYKHGIIRAIPLTNTVQREDGSTARNRAKVSNVYVNKTYKTYTEDGEYCIQIGEGSVYVKGDVNYVIKYTYDIGRDPMLTKDEFYYNIIGTNWDTTIESVDFAVHFPKEFTYTKSSLGFSHGASGSGDFSDVYYRVENDTVYGYYHEELPAYSGLTMRLELPEGYFVRGLSIWDYIGYAAYAVPFLGFFLAWRLYQRYGKNDVIVEPVEFYPPDGRTPMDIGYYYDDRLDNKDVTSLLVHLANKGALTIEEEGESYIIHLKDFPDDGTMEEKMFYSGLAERSDENDDVRESDLKERFYRTINSIVNNFTNLHKKSEVIVPTGKYSALAFLCGIISVFTAMYSLVYFTNYDFTDALFSAGMVTFICAFAVPLISLFTSRKSLIRTIISVILVAAFLLPAGFMVFYGFLDGEFRLNVLSILAILALLSGIGCFYLSSKFYKRTAFGNEILGRIRGFRNFLDSAEKNQLEMLVEEDPTYFYDILPYAYVLGVSDKWIKKFDGIAMQPPEWYYGCNDMNRINDHINDSMTSMTSTMGSSPEPVYSSSGGGGDSSGGGWSSSGSSGGGFSGGGSGGGGGHSW